MLSEDVHQGILKKFDALKGTKLEGKESKKGTTEDRLPPDQYVNEKHILHSLFRGFYKPEGMQYVLSCRVTEVAENYGNQIIWKDKSNFLFDRIEYRPPSRSKDAAKNKDTEAARFNLEKQIPLGLLWKIGVGDDIILGLGIIVKERSDGVFIIKPYTMLNTPLNKTSVSALLEKEDVTFITEVVTEVKSRKGQEKFRKLLLTKYKTCALCGVEASHTRASHIKPWASSTDNERLDIQNGLLLCPNHDYLFDKGLITFKKTGEILISNTLSASQQMNFNINQMLRIQMLDEMQQYMAHHRQFIFKQ